MTIDETGVANVVVWPGLFEKQRRIVLGAWHDEGSMARSSARAVRPSRGAAAV